MVREVLEKMGKDSEIWKRVLEERASKLVASTEEDSLKKSLTKLENGFMFNIGSVEFNCPITNIRKISEDKGGEIYEVTIRLPSDIGSTFFDIESDGEFAEHIFKTHEKGV